MPRCHIDEDFLRWASLMAPRVCELQQHLAREGVDAGVCTICGAALPRDPTRHLFDRHHCEQLISLLNWRVSKQCSLDQCVQVWALPRKQGGHYYFNHATGHQGYLVGGSHKDTSEVPPSRLAPRRVAGNTTPTFGAPEPLNIPANRFSPHEGKHGAHSYSLGPDAETVPSPRKFTADAGSDHILCLEQPSDMSTQTPSSQSLCVDVPRRHHGADMDSTAGPPPPSAQQLRFRVPCPPSVEATSQPPAPRTREGTRSPPEKSSGVPATTMQRKWLLPGVCGDPSMLVWRETLWFCLVCGSLADDCDKRRSSGASPSLGTSLPETRTCEDLKAHIETPGWEPWGEEWESRLKQQRVQQEGHSRCGATHGIQWS